MSVTVQDRRSRLRSALSAGLALLLLVPLSYLAGQVWRPAADDIATIERERRGVEYLAGLGQLLTAVTQTQAAAVQGDPPPAALAEAVDRTAALDQRMGAEFGTQQRWAVLNSRLGKLPRLTAGQELAGFAVYVEASELLLALQRTVRDSSGLARDTQVDTFHLQQAAGVGLPAATVQTARVADLTALAPRVRTFERTALGGALAVAVQRVGETVGAMTADLQAAADDTRSRTLSSSVLSGVDRFRRGADGVVQGGSAVLRPPAEDARPPSPATVAAGLAQLAGLRTDMQTAAGDLSTAMLRETDTLLAGRIDDLRARQRTVLLAVTAAALLALGIVLVAVAGWRRNRTVPPAAPAGVARVPGRPEPGPERARAEAFAGTPGHYGNDIAPAQWERSDVPR